MTRPEDLTGEARDRFQVWRTLGLSESAALDQLRRDGVLAEADPVDQLTESFRALGLSPSAAKTAALGRGDEVSVRRRAKAGAPADARRSEVRETERRQTLAELDELGRRVRELRESFARLDRAGVVPPRRPVTGR
jgi:hypothetical protein